MRPRRLSADTGDEGFTLVEVIVALALLGLIATAALAFFIQSYAQEATVQRHQQAVALTNSALEQARAASPTIPTTGGYGLATGRSQADVTAQWAASTAPDLALTYPAWDPSPSAPPSVPFTIDQTIAGQSYSTKLLVGTCYQPRGVAGAACGRIGAAALPPTPIPSGYSPMVRIIAETTWTPPDHAGCASACTYRVSSLVDPTTDPQWTTGSGEAVNDVTAVTHGASVTIAVLANDSVVAASGTAVQVVSAPPSGQGTVVVQANNTITYSAPSTLAAGTKVAFTYAVMTTAGTRSNTAAVQVTIS